MDFFLDKDILFRYGRRLLFGHKMPQKQLALMQEILAGKHKVSISNNTPFAVLNHLKYRARDPKLLGKSPQEADLLAKSHFKSIFGKGKWELVNLSLSDYEQASRDGRHDWEDAVQYQCVLKTRLPFATDNIRDFEQDKAIRLMPVR